MNIKSSGENAGLCYRMLPMVIMSVQYGITIRVLMLQNAVSISRNYSIITNSPTRKNTIHGIRNREELKELTGF